MRHRPTVISITRGILAAYRLTPHTPTLAPPQVTPKRPAPLEVAHDPLRFGASSGGDGRKKRQRRGPLTRREAGRCLCRGGCSHTRTFAAGPNVTTARRGHVDLTLTPSRAGCQNRTDHSRGPADAVPPGFVRQSPPSHPVPTPCSGVPDGAAAAARSAFPLRHMPLQHSQNPAKIADHPRLDRRQGTPPAPPPGSRCTQRS